MNSRYFQLKPLAVASVSALTLGVLGPVPVVGALAVLQAQAATTSTVGLRVDHDAAATASGARRVVNLGIMGLNAAGNVDTQGEAGGSTIIAEVSSVLGTVSPTATTPATAASGTFAAETRYALLSGGVGMANVTYGNTVSGQDTITVRLMERRSTTTGSVTTNVIAEENIPVSVPGSAVASNGRLHVYQFQKAASDANGGSYATPAAIPASEGADVGITATAAATAGVAGGTFEIRGMVVGADGNYTADTNMNGAVSVVLTGDPTSVEANGNRAAKATTYTLTGTMQNGVALITMPATVTKAGVYTLTASVGSASSEVPYTGGTLVAADRFTVVPAATPAKMGLEVDRKVVSSGLAGGTETGSVAGGGWNVQATFTARLLDAYGNRVYAASQSAQTVRITDANSKFSNLEFALSAGTNSATAKLASSSLSNGQVSATASIPVSSSIAASDPVSLTIVAANGGQLCSSFSGGVLPTAQAVAGSSINKLMYLGVRQSTTAENGGDCSTDATALQKLTTSNQMTVTSLTDNSDGSKDSIVVSVNDALPADYIGGLFHNTLTLANAQANGFLVQDNTGGYADLVVLPNGTAFGGGTDAVAASSATKAYLKDASGNLISTLKARTSGSLFTVSINGGYFSTTDAQGNATAGGQVTITSAKGTVSGGSVAIGNAGSAATITYPANTTGSDTLTLIFSDPGIASVNDSATKQLSVDLPAVGALDKFTMVTEATEVSINGILPLTVIPESGGKPLPTVDGGWIVNVDNGVGLFSATTPLTTTTGIASGANVSTATGTTGMQTFQVRAGSVPGTYAVTVKSVDGTVSATTSITVKEYQGGGSGATQASSTLYTDASGNVTAASVTGIVVAKEVDRGLPGTTYVAAVIPTSNSYSYFFLSKTKGWVLWDGMAIPEYYDVVGSLNQSTIPIVDMGPIDVLNSLAGVQIWLGYGLGTPPFSNPWQSMIDRYTYNLGCVVQVGQACVPQ